MFGFLKPKRKTLIAMDVGSNVVKCLRLDASGERPVITHFAMVPLPPEAIVDGDVMDRELVIQALIDCAAKAGVPDEPVATSVSGRAVIVKKIVMDKMSREDAREAIYWEAEQHVPFDIDDITLDFQILQEDIGAGQMEILLVAAKKDMILSHAELLRDAGFQPVVVDVASFATQNAWEFSCSQVLPGSEETAAAPPDDIGFENAEFDSDDYADVDEPEPSASGHEGEFVALLDVGGGMTNVHIVKNGVPYFTRDLPIGTSHFTEEFQKQLGLTYETAQSVAMGNTEEVDEQLVADIIESVGSEIVHGLEPSLSYLKTSGEADGIERVVLSGGGARLPGLADYLSRSYDVPGELADPLAVLDYEPEIFTGDEPGELSPMLAVSVGLALRKAVDS